MNNSYDYLFKFILVGDSNVGKSCLLLRYTQNKYKSQHQPTLGVEFGSKNVIISNLNIRIQIWDTAGQQSFRSITRSYYKGSIVAIIVYDISKRKTFQNVMKWLNEIKTHSHQKIQILLIGAKSDLSSTRQVTYEQGQKLAKNNNFNFIETSAKTGQMVQQAFRKIAEKVLNKIQNGQINAQSNYGVKIGKKKKSSPSPNKNQFISKSPNDQNIRKNCQC